MSYSSAANVVLQELGTPVVSLWGIYGRVRNGPSEGMSHTPCLRLQVMGHGGILEFPVGFTARSPCEIRQQLPVVNGMIQSLCFFEFWTRVLALSMEKLKNSFPTAHVYSV